MVAMVTGPVSGWTCTKDSPSLCTFSDGVSANSEAKTNSIIAMAVAIPGAAILASIGNFPRNFLKIYHNFRWFVIKHEIIQKN